DVVHIPPGLDTAPGSLDASTFLDWNAGQQLAYVKAHGGGTQTIGLAGAPQLTVTVGPGGVGVTITYRAPNVLPAALTATAFEDWPIGTQLAYVNANGSGSPKSVMIGTGSNRALATIETLIASVSLVTIPPDFDKKPADLDAHAFNDWRSDQQL